MLIFFLILIEKWFKSPFNDMDPLIMPIPFKPLIRSIVSAKRISSESSGKVSLISGNLIRMIGKNCLRTRQN